MGGGHDPGFKEVAQEGDVAGLEDGGVHVCSLTWTIFFDQKAGNYWC